jgi:hypothetical protein
MKYYDTIITSAVIEIEVIAPKILPDGDGLSLKITAKLLRFLHDLL